MSSQRSDWRERIHTNPSRMERELAFRLQEDRIVWNSASNSALNFWQGGKYAAEKGGLQTAVGLWILALEEIGKHVLLHEAATEADEKGKLKVRVRDFMNHVNKAKNGSTIRVRDPLALLAKTGSYTIHDNGTRRTRSTERPETR